MLRSLQAVAQAAIEAGDLAEQQRHDQNRALALELEQAHYQAGLAARRYEAVDPDSRLVAAELEARWNGALLNLLAAFIAAVHKGFADLRERRPRAHAQ